MASSSNAGQLFNWSTLDRSFLYQLNCLPNSWNWCLEYGGRLWLCGRWIFSSHRNTLLLEKPAPAIVVRADADDPGLQMLSDHTQMAEKYLQELPTYSGKVTFFQALEQPLGQGWYIEEKFGWGKFAVGEWESHLISGNHKTMFHEPHVQKLGETLKSCLDNLP